MEIVEKTIIPDLEFGFKNIQHRQIAEILGKTTHLCIAAHQDDVEIMAYHGIRDCFQSNTRFFTAVIVTNGLGSPKSDSYESLSDEEFRNLRRKEQLKAALIGEYNAVIFLDFWSRDLKKTISNKGDESLTGEPRFHEVLSALTEILRITSPQVIYTHSLFDSHETHGALCKLALEAVVSSEQPIRDNLAHVYGCEVWGSLDWVPGKYRVNLDCSDKPNLQRAVLGVFDSQISRGKFFDDASMGRRKANATFLHTGEKDACTGITNALELIDIALSRIPLKDYIDNLLGDFLQRVHRTLL